MAIDDPKEPPKSAEQLINESLLRSAEVQPKRPGRPSESIVEVDDKKLLEQENARLAELQKSRSGLLKRSDDADRAYREHLVKFGDVAKPSGKGSGEPDKGGGGVGGR